MSLSQRHILDATITDLKSARAVIRIKRKLYPNSKSNQKIIVPHHVYNHIQEQLRAAKQAWWGQIYYSGFKVDGEPARMGYWK